MRRLAPVIGAAVLLAVSWAPALAASSQETLAALANRERSGSGLGALSLESTLSEIAIRHATEMARTGRLYHNSTLAQQITGWQLIGENVGRGAGLDQIHAAFMASSPHRAQILGSRYNAVGVGVAVGASGVLWVDEIFVSRIGPVPALAGAPVTATVVPTRRMAPARTDPPPAAKATATPPSAAPPPPAESVAPPPAESGVPPPAPAATVQALLVVRDVKPYGDRTPEPPLIAAGLGLLCLAVGGQVLRLARRGDGAQ